MNYLFLKTIIENIIKNFKCKSCKMGIQENNIGIESIDNKWVQIKINCPGCHEIFKIQAQVQIATPGKNTTENLTKESSQKEEGPSIKDEDIVSLRNALKKGTSVSELMKWE